MKFFTLGLALFLACSFGLAQESKPARHLVLGMDGVPHRVFADLQAQGYFRDFRPVSKMIAPFPSISNYSWSQVWGTEPIEGYLHRHFNPKVNGVFGSVSEETTIMAFPNKFDFFTSGVIHHLKGYVNGMKNLKGDFLRLKNEVLKDNSVQQYYAYTVETDALGHMSGLEKLAEGLKFADQVLTELRREHLAKFNQPLEITLVSDHGLNTIRDFKFADGKVFEDLASAGFRVGQKIENDSDIVYVAAGMDPAMMFWMNDARKLEATQFFKKYDWAQFIATIDPTTREFIVSGFEKDEIRFVWNKNNKTYTFTKLPTNNALNLPVPHLGEGLSYSEEELFELTNQSEFPNVIERIRLSLTDGVRYPAAILISLREGYLRADGLTKKAFNLTHGNTFTTHGSALRNESLGILVSTKQQFPEWVRANDVPKLIENHDFPSRFADVMISFKEDKSREIRIGKQILDLPGIEKIRVEILKVRLGKDSPNLKTIITVPKAAIEHRASDSHLDVRLPDLERSPNTARVTLTVKALGHKDKILGLTNDIELSSKFIYGRKFAPLKRKK